MNSPASCPGTGRPLRPQHRLPDPPSPFNTQSTTRPPAPARSASRVTIRHAMSASGHAYEQTALADRQSGGLIKGDHARAPPILAQHVGSLGRKAGLASTTGTTEKADSYGPLIVACPGKQLFAVVFTTDQGRREAGTPREQGEDCEA